MDNLKYDLLSKLSSEKYLAEIELNECANSQTLSYRAKLENILHIIGEIILINSKIGMVDQYFLENEPENYQEDQK
jgi:hypothetical protein